MPGEFQGKVVVITGGSRGIGREIAVDFAKAGAQTVIVSSSEANLAAATKTVAAAGGPAPLAIAADLRRRSKAASRCSSRCRTSSSAATSW